MAILWILLTSTEQKGCLGWGGGVVSVSTVGILTVCSCVYWGAGIKSGYSGDIVNIHRAKGVFGVGGRERHVCTGLG